MSSLFGLFKKKETLDIPEPPGPPAPPGPFFGDLPPVRGSELQAPPAPPAPQTARQVPTPPQQTAAERKTTPIKTRTTVGPLFISINDYQEALSKTAAITEAVEQSKQLVAQIERLTEATEHTLTAWSKQVEDIEKKLSYADDLIAKTGEQ